MTIFPRPLTPNGRLREVLTRFGIDSTERPTKDVIDLDSVTQILSWDGVASAVVVGNLYVCITGDGWDCGIVGSQAMHRGVSIYEAVEWLDR